VKKNKQNTIAILLVLIFGFFLFYIGTDGFNAYTQETARAIQLEKDNPSFPKVMLEDSKARSYSFSEFKGKYVLITFVYTTCTDVCPQLEMNLAGVYKQIPEKYLGEDIVFLSISFDPDRDSVEALQKYSQYFHSDEDTWRMARIPDKNQLQHLLDVFGVVVIPDDSGNFTHNAAFYLVDPKGQLVEVMDYKQIDESADKVKAILEREAGDKR
jgi:protein SCO1